MKGPTMSHRNLIAALFLGTALACSATAAFAAPQHVTTCRDQVPPDFLAKHPISMCWQHPGDDPAFHNLKEAMDGREAIFSKFEGWTPGLVAAAITASNGAHREVMITKRNYFNDMAEGGFVVVNGGVLADFKDMPKGITDNTGGLFLKAWMWEFTYEGKVYRIFLPIICFNWADRLRDTPPPPTITPLPNGCVEIAYKMNAGDTMMFGVGTTSEDLPLSECTAQQKPGEDRFETNFRQEACVGTCTIEVLANQRGKRLLAGPRETFTATQNGYYVVRLPRAVVERLGVFDEYGCLHRFDGHRSYGEYDTSENFTDGKAFVVYDREKDVISNWSGKALEWRFPPFYGEQDTH